jgi:hypothetical protein
MMAQVRPYTHLNIRQEFQVLACQALVDSPKHTADPLATDGKGKVSASSGSK